MLKLLPILFFAAVNVTQISIFEIEGIFSSVTLMLLKDTLMKIKLTMMNSSLSSTTPMM